MAHSRLMSWEFLVVGVLIAGCGTAVGSPSVSAPLPSQRATMVTPNGASSQPAPPSPELPAALQDTWVSETRSIPGLTPPAVESFMELSRHQLVFHASEDWTAPILSSVAAADGATGLRLRLEDDSVSCVAGTEGAYAFELSPSERALDVAVVADSCAARIAALSGAWTRIDCPDNHNCLGDLDAGAHASVIYTPFAPFADWQYDYGRFSYTVPDGWTNPEDNKDGYVLVPQAGPEGAGIYVFSDVLAHAQAHDPATGYCQAAPEPRVGSSAPELRDWIRSLPGLSVSHEDHVTIGGLTGFAMDLSVDPGWKRTCGWPGATPGVPLFVNAQTTPDEGLDWGVDSKGRMRLFILRLDRDRNLVVDIEAQDTAAWNALLPVAGPIVETFAFRH